MKQWTIETPRRKWLDYHSFVRIKFVRVTDRTSQYPRLPTTWNKRYEWHKNATHTLEPHDTPFNLALDDLLTVHEQKGTILCNLTRRKYVDGKKAAKMVKESQLTNKVDHLLGFILARRVCWTTNKKIPPPAEDSYYEKRWAGHRFEVDRAK